MLRDSKITSKVYESVGALDTTPGSRSFYRGYLVVADFRARLYFF